MMPPLWKKTKRNYRASWWVKEESEKKTVLTLNIQKTKILACSPIISWQMDGETMEAVTDFTFLGSKITADGDCSHEIKDTCSLGRKAMTNLDSILKSRDITLPTKVNLVKAMFFPAIMHGCQSWTIKKAEHGRIDAFELWCWRRLLRVLWTTRRPNQSVLKELRPEYSLEELMLKLQYLATWFKELTCWKRPWLGKIEDRRRRGRQRMRCLDGITNSMDMSLSKLRRWWRTGKPGVLQSMGSQSQTRLSDWRTTILLYSGL